MDVLDIWKHHESIGVQRGENRQNLERHSPKRKEYSGTQVFYRAIGRRKLAYVKQLLFPRFSSSQIFFLQHKGGLEFEAFFTTSHVVIVVTGGYWARGGISAGTVGGGGSIVGTQKQYIRCKEVACKPGGHKPPSLQSDRKDVHRRLSHSHQSFGLSISRQVPEGVLGELSRISNSTAAESK